MQYKLKSHGTNSPTRNRMHVRLRMMLLIVSVTVPPGWAYEAESVADLYSATGIRGGVVVQLGVQDGKEIAALRSGESFLVQGLEKDRSKIGPVRKYLSSQGIHGAATVREFDGRHLPYIDNLVNLIVVADRISVSEEEMLRVLVPGGQAVVIDQGSGAVQRRLAKPQPDDTDEFFPSSMT